MVGVCKKILEDTKVLKLKKHILITKANFTKTDNGV